MGQKYADAIQDWQRQAHFSPDVAWVRNMIIQDAQRILELLKTIAGLDDAIESLNKQSDITCHIQSIVGFDPTCSAELAGEIGTLDRFASEATSISAWPCLRSSGTYQGSGTPRQVNTHAKVAMMTAVARHINHVPSSKT